MNVIRELQTLHPQIGLAMASTLLVIYGSDINRFLRRRIRTWTFIGRLAFFVCLCVFGYGLAVVFFSRILSIFLASLDPWMFLAAILGGFLLLGFLAEKKKQM